MVSLSQFSVDPFVIRFEQLAGGPSHPVLSLSISEQVRFGQTSGRAFVVQHFVNCGAKLPPIEEESGIPI
jgi:hypothetical protein